MTKEVVRAYCASVFFNGDFICVETDSGYGGSSTRDPKGKQHLLAPDVSDEVLGGAVSDAMAHSRFVLPAARTDVWIHPDVEFDMSLYDYKQVEAVYAAWIKKLMEHYSYKTKKALFKNMQNVSIERKSGFITFKPWHHEELEAWSGIKGDEVKDVVIPDTSTAIEIGAALRLTLSRCTE